MNKTSFFSVAIFLALFIGCSSTPKRLTDFVNPFLGTATLWAEDSLDLGFVPTFRAWGGEVYPGATLPFGMVQATPVTLYGSGSGYQYEDTVIYAFFHTSMGHWNLGHVPILPFTGEITADNYHSSYSNDNESARPGYYQVYLERYGINAEMTVSLRCAHHRFTFQKGDEKKLKINLSRMNRRGRAIMNWSFNQVNENTFSGAQEDIFFYAITNHKISSVDSLQADRERKKIIKFADQNAPLELQIGFSFVSVEKAKQNLEEEMLGKSFEKVFDDADKRWEELLQKVEITGGTDRQRWLFYTSLYRSLLWPAMRSDGDGEFRDERRNVVNKGFHYYPDPAYWDDYRNKLILMGMLSPEVTVDVINSIIDRSKIRRFMPTYFHGDFAPVFVAGSYLRGLRGFDVDSAYYFMLRNATVENRRARLYLDEYNEKGWIAENNVLNPTTRTEVDEAKAAVTKTLEYAYTDYGVALLAKELGDMENYTMLMQRSGNFRNVFDPKTGFMRGRLENGEWWEPFDPGYPYYVFMYREASAWHSTFFAPHDPHGLVALWPSKETFEQKLDELYSSPWGGYEAHNFTTFIGQHCVGNQPGQGYAFMYYFVDKQEKAQTILDSIMNHKYGMGKYGLALAGMDDSGGLSAWYALNAMGLYTFSPADPEYIISVPLFDKVVFHLGETPFTIRREGSGRKIRSITYDGQKINGYFISHDDLKRGKELVITTE